VCILSLISCQIANQYLINPRHPDFAQLAIGTPQNFPFDPRFWQ
jgi:hypothetical protein